MVFLVLPDHPWMKKSPKIKLVLASEVDRPQVEQFCRQHLYPGEPLCVAGGNGDQPSDEYVITTLHSLGEGKSLLAYIDDKLVGVSINREINDDEVDLRRMIYENVDERLRNECKFWWIVEEQADFFRRFGIKKAFFIESMAVDLSVKNSGVSVALFHMSVDLGRKLGYEVVRVDTSSFYAARRCEELGLTKVFAMKYDDYKDEDGKRIFNIPDPHTDYSVWYRSKL